MPKKDTKFNVRFFGTDQTAKVTESFMAKYCQELLEKYNVNKNKKYKRFSLAVEQIAEVQNKNLSKIQNKNNKKKTSVRNDILS